MALPINSIIYRKGENMHLRYFQYLDLLVRYLKPQLGKVLFLILLIFSNLVIQLINPQLLKYFIDEESTNDPFYKLISTALFFIAGVLISQFLAAFISYLSEKIGWIATNLLRVDLTRHCLRLDMSFHNTYSPGELIERIDGDVSKLNNFLSQFIIRIFSNFLLLVGIILLLFRESWWIGLATILITSFAFLAIKRVQALAAPHFRAWLQSVANLSSFWEERLSGTEDIGANRAQMHTMASMFLLMRFSAGKQKESYFLSQMLQSTLELFLSLVNAAVFTIGAYLISNRSITIGTMYLIFYYTNLLSTNLSEITTQINDLQTASASIERVYKLYHTESNIQDGYKALLQPGPLTIDFEQVSFNYTNDIPVLVDLSLHIEPGKILGVLGRTGSGKTTLTRLLLRLYDPRAGTIRMNGIDIRDVPLANLRQRIGVMTQDVQLLPSTIRNNISFFDPAITDERILQVLSELGLSEWYKLLPQGLDTEISRESGLSAGEAQLLTLARVFLQDPDIIILDEAFSRLDSTTEQLIEKTIRKLLRNRTAIVVTHNLQTTQWVDNILILKNGRINEYGNREQLMADSRSHFYHLAQLEIGETFQ